ncbi:type I methionyl aminopeptidase [Candidatus Peregrinibacteria bacterium CG10_big_fil_rev_8_21_14_0_10_36_19]|nr:MAG: type I methionyl aminopeptidase [Candidatus Peregrinibacteria bacterium CG10_big_fil_rev_8_21_14_0_10_36_19]
MAITIKTPEEIEIMRKAGKILATVLEEVCNKAKAGVSTKELDIFAEELIIKMGGKPAFKGFHNYPATLCTAIDSVIVHGIPRNDEILKEGDLFTADCGVILDGLYTDAARTIGIGEISPLKKRLIETAKTAFYKGVDAAKPGKKVSEISKAIEETINEANFKVIYDLTGHGIGRSLHEDPIVLNYYDGERGAQLKPGMTIAIEPIFAVSTHELKTLSDGWTIVTDDDSLAVQYENTVLITQTGAEILTEL